MFRRVLAGASSAALVAGFALVSTPAQADVDGTIVPDGVGFIETVTVEDAGGVAYDLKLDWNYKYVDAAGATRVSVNPLCVHRSDAEVIGAGEPEDAGLDIHYDVSSHGTVRWTQHVLLDNVNLDAGKDNVAFFNPRNPISDAGNTFIRVKVGTDGDGLGSSRWVTFIQPAGIGLKPAV